MEPRAAEIASPGRGRMGWRRHRACTFLHTHLRWCSGVHALDATADDSSFDRAFAVVGVDLA
jgi:hypothetical protein